MERIYLDHNATTRLSRESLEEMQPYLREHYGNSSSLHWAGRTARRGLEEARLRVASLLGCSSGEILFTAGGSESNNLALKGLYRARRTEGKRHLVTTAIEHPSILEVARDLEEEGAHVTYLPPDRWGRLTAEEVKEAIDEETFLVSVIAVNNETGVRQPFEEIGLRCREQKVPYHCDGVQLLGKEALCLKELPVDLLSFSGHKFYGPKGSGGLYLRRGVRVNRLIAGGHQERSLRAGTENIPALVGMGAAAQLAQKEMEEGHPQTIAALCRQLEEGLLETVPGASLNGHPEQRIGNTCNIGFPGIEGEALLLNLDLAGIAVSAGSACSSGSLEPSATLQAMGLRPTEAYSSLRFSLGRENTEAEIKRVLEVLPPLVQKLRSLSSPLS